MNKSDGQKLLTSLAIIAMRTPPQLRHERWNVAAVVTCRGRGIFMGLQNSICTQDVHRPTSETSCGVIKVGIPRRKRAQQTI